MSVSGSPPDEPDQDGENASGDGNNPGTGTGSNEPVRNANLRARLRELDLMTSLEDMDAGERFGGWHRIIYRFRQNPMSILGLVIILIFVVMAVFAPYIAPYPSAAGSTVHFDQRFQPPSLAHPFGTDQVGRDILSRVIFGSRISLTLGFIVVSLAIVIGVPIGLVAGYVGGSVGMTFMRITDVFLSIPPLVLALAVSVAMEPTLTNSMIAIAIVWWPWYARLVYGEVISVKEETFIEASRGIGASTTRILSRDILPNIIAPITVKFSLDMGYAILVGAALGFLGLGAQPPTPEWGTMTAAGREYLPGKWWYSTFPGLAIFFAVLGFNFLGDGLRDIFDVEVE